MDAPRETTYGFWPFRPRLLENESFASWFARTAWANGLSAAELYPITLPGARMFRIDLDRFACDELIKNLSAHTGISLDKLWPRTFKVWAGHLFEQDDGQVKLIWLTPAGFRQTNKSFGQQVCPQCLREAKIPYLKQQWRLSFITACDHHRTLLVDRCPVCAAPIQPLYTPASVGTVYTCWSCGFDLRNAVTQQINDLSHQQRLLKIAQDGWGELGTYGPVMALVYFRILWILYRMVCTGRFSLPLRTWVGGTKPPSGLPRIKEIERLNPRCRHVLVTMALDLMQDWPRHFLSACQDLGITTCTMLKNKHSIERTPFALWEPVSFTLSAPVHTATPADLKMAKALLKARGERPTYQALQKLLRLHFHAYRCMALPANKHVPYGTHRYWKLDGVSPEVRAAAKKAAHKNGENVGAWVDKTLRQALELFDEI